MLKKYVENVVKFIITNILLRLKVIHVYYLKTLLNYTLYFSKLYIMVSGDAIKNCNTFYKIHIKKSTYKLWNVLVAIIYVSIHKICYLDWCVQYLYKRNVKNN